MTDKFNIKKFEKEVLDIAKKEASKTILEIKCPNCNHTFKAKAGTRTCPKCKKTTNIKLEFKK